jgi:uncharacterized protein YbjT (DUF2867 family)
MKIAITGGTGFIGGHLAKAIEKEGHEVVLLSRRLGVDVSDKSTLKEALKGCEAIAHCAGINREIGKQTFDEIHVKGSQNIVDAAKDLGIDKILLLSFLKARPGCGSPYHESKWAAEEIFRHSGLNYTIIKAGVVYGKGDHMLDHISHAFHTFPLFAFVGLKSKKVRPLAVDDLLTILKGALTGGRLSSKTVSVTGPEEMNLSEAVRRIARATNKKPFFFRLPLIFHYSLAFFCERVMKIPLIAKAQVRILAEGVVGPGVACEYLPDDLKPQQNFSQKNIIAGLPEAKAFGLQDLRCACKSI